jgi:transcriptional regulator with AAA-type ATPase domain
MIYFIQQGKTGPIKIGYTENDIAKRLASLQVASAEKLTLLGVIEGGKKQEKLIHKFFHANQMEGEWFKPVPAIQDYILSLILGTPIKKIKYHESGLGVDVILANQEKTLVLKALAQCHNDYKKTAALLQITIRSLRYRIEKLDIDF